MGVTVNRIREVTQIKTWFRTSCRRKLVEGSDGLTLPSTSFISLLVTDKVTYLDPKFRSVGLTSRDSQGWMCVGHIECLGRLHPSRRP